MINKITDRRVFLKGSACAALGAAGLPYVIPSSVLGKSGNVAASSRITIGCIGLGNQGSALMRGFLGKTDVQIVAVCDVHSAKRQGASEVVRQKYAAKGSGNFKGCSTYNDFRDLICRSDIDAVTVAPPDHWHVPISIAAVREGKDIYLEKPIGVSLDQVWALREAIQRYGTIFQFGTQQRSDARFRRACELVRNGRLGKLHKINVWSPSSDSGGSTKPATAPPELDYKMWLGPAPWSPYTKDRCANVNPYFRSADKIWPFISDYCIGWISGWGVHPLDIALWGADKELRGIVEVEGIGDFPTIGACDTATNWNVILNYPSSGVKIDFRGTGGRNGPAPVEWRRRYPGAGGHGTVFEGSEGWIHVRRGHIDANPKSLLESRIGADEIQLYNSNDHVRNFLDCVKTRAETICPIEAAVRVETVCHLSDIATLLERKVTWNPEQEQFINDDTANRLLVRAMRSPWHL